MKQCETCGNEYDHLIEIVKNGRSHWFDCFECAIHQLAPRCSHCGVQILGHGVQGENKIYCGAHCARVQGLDGFVDRIA